MENYSDCGSCARQLLKSSGTVDPLVQRPRRIQGLIGIDDNRDDLFNYSRVIQTFADVDGDPTTLRLGEVQNIIDPDHETMGANITVLAYHDVDANGVIDPTDVLVDQFVTGADGNYYFDSGA